MSETPELSELTREQLIEIIRESSELFGVMREDRNRVVGELEARPGRLLRADGAGASGAGGSAS